MAKTLRVARLGALSIVLFAPALWFFTKYNPSREVFICEYPLPPRFSWEEIVPTDDLIWHDCYSDHQCARLKVPLDYAHPNASSAAIALRRIHSRLPHNSSEYLGPILINPGGPGGSGVDAVGSYGANLSVIVGPQFDIVGFDPRGISRSTPRVSFFESRAERELWNSDPPSNANASGDAIARRWARSAIEGQLAGERDDGSLRFINTDYTARDMMKIVEAHGRTRLQYWGFSYGTALGATFASLFPDNVERLVIDGVVEPSWFENEWANYMADTDKIWTSFVEGCVAAGPEGCAFFEPSSAKLREKMNRLYASVRARPVPVRTPTSYGLVTYSMLRNTIFFSLYAPFRKFPSLAQALADLSAGNGTALFYMAKPEPLFECACDPTEHMFDSVGEAGVAVVCNDGKRYSSSYEDALKQFREMSEGSPWYDVAGPMRIQCSAWPEFPKYNFQGPFAGNTSFPVLLIGNTADPVCPLWAAKKMSEGFPGSVVLTQDSPGHCSLAAPSICTPKYIREYFVNGTLPAPGTVCPTFGSPFPTKDNLSAGASEVDAESPQTVLGSLSAADRELWDSVIELATRTFDVPVGF